MKIKAIITYKDWLLMTRHELKPKIGDKYLHGFSSEREIKINDILRFERFGIDAFYNYYVEIEITINENEKNNTQPDIES